MTTSTNPDIDGIDEVPDDRIEAFADREEAARAPIQALVDALHDANPERLLDRINEQGQSGDLLALLKRKLAGRSPETMPRDALLAVCRASVDETLGLVEPVDLGEVEFPAPLSPLEFAEEDAAARLREVRQALERWSVGAVSARAAWIAVKGLATMADEEPHRL